MTTKSVPLPGEYIREEIDARGWSQRDVAYILGWSEQVLTNTLNGKRKINPEVAKELSKAFDVPAELFANLQRAYDLNKAKEPDPGIETRATLQAVYPVRDMIKRGWFEDSDPGILAAQVIRFFNVKALSDVPQLPHAAKRSGSYMDKMNPKQLAWLFRVRQIAKALDVPPYSKEKLSKALSTIRYLMVDPADIRQVPRILMECGVRFVIVEHLPGTQIDGVAFWLDKKSPVIGMSLLRDRIDNAWFTIHHEIEHILQRHGITAPMVDVELNGTSDDSQPEEETIANTAAADRCAPIEAMNDFVQRKQPYISERDVIGFAKLHQIHPGIVVGQIHARTKRFDFLARYLVKTREIMISDAPYDGWGHTHPVEL